MIHSHPSVRDRILMTPLIPLFDFNLSPLCSASSSYSRSSQFKFISPSVSQRSLLTTVESRASTPRASTRIAIATNNNDSGSARNRFCVSSRRRALAFVATLPTILLLNEPSLDGFVAKADGLPTSEYLLMTEEVRKVLSKGNAAGVLRLVFHDAGTFDMDDNSGGMNGSIVYELDRPENVGLKKPVKILDKAKTEVDAIRPGAEAVSVCGGPTIPVPLGRLDSMEPDPEGKLPQESLDALSLKQCFQRKGLTTQDLVALSGAHTVGNKGFGNPTVFDNAYFKILLQKPWKSSGGMIGLPSDHAIADDDECLRWITKYAESENMFFEDFKNAYIKLVNSGAKWKNS
ncbi:putative L-ascorbate peroxidase 6 isoform X2 [Juglans microcarpa x Juglans regia]|uniref:putative L-ascorbate peroxidase 6 isoform X2 n=1 Tax=Juglans microcarpa x Juglans regia TaxID=2249226 RepID=UPI001B7F0C1A|nr:putative L-ascorbate peroxidase 6 isoform X2 [Juglans microcarpa x Juglans regia]